MSERSDSTTTVDRLGTLSPGPWDLSLWTRNMVKGRRRRVPTTSPVSPGRDGARVGSHQSPILRRDRFSVSKGETCPQGSSGGFGVEDLEGGLEAQALAGSMVELADVGAE